MKYFLSGFVLMFLFSTIIQAAGDLDPLFGAGGKVTRDLGFGETASAMALQPDGKIIVGGRSFGVLSDFVVIRFNPNGTLDPTFGSGGIVTTDFSGDVDNLFDVELQADGKIVAVGSTKPAPTSLSEITVVRYNPNGSLDPTFGSGGKVTTGVTDREAAASGIAIHLDGRIAVGAVAVDTENITAICLIFQYNPNGTPDPTFGNGGQVTLNLPDGYGSEGVEVIIQPDDKIVVAGGVPQNGSPDVQDFLVVRLNPNGSNDPTFGAGGIVITDFSGGVDVATAALIQPDGKIVAAGLVNSSAQFDFGVVRYNPNGSLDPTFGNGGKVTTDISGNSDMPFAIVVQPNGKIATAGVSDSDFALVRYNPNGSLDPTFGQGGITTTDFNGGGDGVNDMVLQVDGKIVVAGFASDNDFDFALARYNGDIIVTSCNLFSDNFDDGILAADWNYVRNSWNELGGNLVGTPAGSKAEVIADPAFGGCGTGPCTVQTFMQTAGGRSNKLFFFAWFQDKQNTLEVLMKEQNDKWIIRQRSGGRIVAKTKLLAPIVPGVSYNVLVIFDGTTFRLIIDNTNQVTLNAAVTPSGTIGFRVKKTTGSFASICVN
jgi:uncharacterized delta-60 repeat protein